MHAMLGGPVSLILLTVIINIERVSRVTVVD